MRRFEGRVALVTAGAQGIGAAVARRLAEEGASVVVTDLQEEKVAEVAAGIGEQALGLRVDVTSRPDVDAAVAAAVERFGRLDVVVNNAGGSPYTLAADASPRFAAKIVELNLLAPLIVAQAANGVMQRQRDGGTIVMVSSVSGHRPSPGTAAYGAAKAGLDSLVGSLAIEWAPKVRVNSVVAGPVRTEQAHLHYGDAARVAAVGRTIPIGRLAEPEDIGRCVALLASPLASYVTGATLAAHGGGERPAFLAAAKGADHGAV